MSFDLAGTLSFGTPKSEWSVGINLPVSDPRKRFATYWISGRSSRLLCQHSSTSFHTGAERPNFEASTGCGGRSPFTTAS